MPLWQVIQLAVSVGVIRRTQKSRTALSLTQEIEIVSVLEHIATPSLDCVRVPVKQSMREATNGAETVPGDVRYVARAAISIID